MDIDDDAAFAAGVRRRREELGFSQAELGARFGELTGTALTQQAIAQIEAPLGKRRRVTVGEALALADALEDSIEHLTYREFSARTQLRRAQAALQAIVDVVESRDFRVAMDADSWPEAGDHDSNSSTEGSDGDR